MVIGPGRGVGGSRWSSSDDRNSRGLGRESLRWGLYLNPLLRSGQIVASVPLVLSGGIRSGIADISIRYRAVYNSLV